MKYRATDLSHRSARRYRLPWLGLLLGMAAVLATAFGCHQSTGPQSQPSTPASTLSVAVSPSGFLAVKTPAAEFDVLSTGYVRAFLLKDGRQLTLDEPNAAPATPGSVVDSAGNSIRDIALDFSNAKISEPQGKMGTRGKKVEIRGRSASSGLEETLTLEVYDDFPTVAITSAAFRNSGSAAVPLDKVRTQRHRLNAALADSNAAPIQLWSFHGASIHWGKDDVFPIPRKFSQQNQMGSLVPVKDDLGSVGGGIPVVAFWTRSVGEAIGHIETLPLVLSLPVETATDGSIVTEMALEPSSSLQPGEVFSTPRSFVAVYSGDYYEPLSLYSSMLE